MGLTRTTDTAGAGRVASGQELAAVAELMEPSERLVGDPPLYSPQPVDLALLLLLLSPPEPEDDPDE